MDTAFFSIYICKTINMFQFSAKIGDEVIETLGNPVVLKLAKLEKILYFISCTIRKTRNSI